MKARLITGIIMAVTTAALIAWDIVVAVNQVSGDTISEIMLHTAQRFLVLTAAWGVLMGHWFFPRKPILSPRATLLILILYGAGWLIWDIMNLFHPDHAHNWLGQNLYVVFFPSIGFGHLFWSQKSAK